MLTYISARIGFRYALVAFSLLSVSLANEVRADDFSDARAFIAGGQYDKAVTLLERRISSGHTDAKTYYELGRAYNWKNDNVKALENFRKAAKLDPGAYATSAIQILDTVKDRDEIVRLGEAAVQNGNRKPTVLVALLDTYFDAKNTKPYDRILELVKSQHYSSAEDKDYRLYILAKSEMRAGHPDAAIAYASELGDKRFLKFMATMDLFKPIAGDERFKKLLD